MLKKKYAANGQFCSVTFKLAPPVDVQSVYLCGDFNEWNPNSHSMKQNKDGSFTLTLKLESKRSYRFRYLFNDGRWENDWEADRYEPNPFGSDDSILDLTNTASDAETA